VSARAAACKRPGGSHNVRPGSNTGRNDAYRSVITLRGARQPSWSGHIQSRLRWKALIEVLEMRSPK